MAAEFAAQTAPVEGRAGVVFFFNALAFAGLHVGVSEDSLEAGEVVYSIERGAFFFGIERHFERNVFEHSMNAEAQMNQRLVLFFGEIPHADGSAADASAEVAPRTVTSGSVCLKLRVPQGPLVFLRQVQPPALRGLTVQIPGSVIEIGFGRQRLPRQIGDFDMHGALVSQPVISGSGIGFPVQVAGLVQGPIQIQVKMTAFEGAVLEDLMAMVGAVTDIVMEHQLMDGLAQLLISFLRIGDPVGGFFLRGGVIQ